MFDPSTPDLPIASPDQSSVDRRAFLVKAAATSVIGLAAGPLGLDAMASPANSYAAVRRYEGVKDVKETAKRASSGFIPIVSKIAGFQSYMLIDVGNGTVVTVSVFASQASADESTKAAAGWVKQNLAALVPNPPQVSAGTVLAHKG